LEELLYLSTEDKLDLFSILLLYSYSFLASYPGSAIMYKTNGKENTEEVEDEDVKEMYILLSGILTVVVTSAAVRGTISSPIAVVNVRCSLYPNIHPSLV
jgi:hypothetical protein